MRVDWHRRQIVLGGLLTVVPSFCCSPTHAQYHSGCWAGEDEPYSTDKGGSAPAKDEYFTRSGVDGLEYALVQTLNSLSDMFGVLPGFVYFRERGRPDAKSSDRDLAGNRPDGTVMLGINLVKELLELPAHPDAGVVAVCAHEFAHILSYSNRMIERLQPAGASAFRSEQFADYMAGYYAGRRRLRQPDFPAVVFATTTRMYGGVDHGTSDERSDAVQEGFLCAYLRKAEPQSATSRALTYALERHA